MEFYGAADYGDAAGAFKNAIRQNPADYHSHYYLASCYAKSNSYHQAIQQYQTCLAVMEHSLEGKYDTPFRMKALDGLAQAYAKTDDQSAQMVATTHPGSREAEDFFLQAKVNRYRGDADGAVEGYGQACLLDNQNFDYTKEYGLYLEQLGQPEAADPQLRRAYVMNTKDEDVQAALRRIGVVPGPSLKPESQLAKPIIPEGPIPKYDITKVRLQNPFTAGQDDNATSSTGGDSAPKD
jgi:tetratricopeptide (TPR) repeat protein